ncbi:MAG: dicarboxylate/amino acid:cation symporter [Muribaculaceae bacterium]|nr:dicarboxylate/amino acid:cation symporter [Muribaculaceae bacterium]
MKSLKKLGLLPYIIIAIALGLLCGWGCAQSAEMTWAVRLCATFNAIFSEYLGFIIPLLILGFVAPAIADLGAKAGKMLLFTAALAYVFTLMAGFISYGVSSLCFKQLIDPSVSIAEVEDAAAVAPYFTMDIEPLMGVLSALVLAFILGIGTARVGSKALADVLSGLRDVISWVIAKSIIPLLPVYIFSIFVGMSYTGDAWPMLVAFGKVIGVIFVMHIGILVLQYCISGLVAKTNPLKSLWTMMPAYFTALGTSSSAATIPVTLRRAQLLGVSPEVAGFTVPLCATIHMSGSTLKIVACALALMIMQGHPYDLGMFAQFIAMLGISIIAAPGVPGGAIMASLGILSSILGFTEADCALMIALYISMDSFGTACNVTGDGAIAQIVNRAFPTK